MAELATIARPYAEALFQACTSSSSASDLSVATKWLQELAAFAANEQLQQFADNPKVSTQQVFDLIAGSVKSALPDMAKNFLRTVLDNARLQALPEVATQFKALVNARSGASDAVVYSAFELDAATLADLTITLGKRFDRKLNLTQKLDPTLIGGIRVVVGDEVLDTSVKARLEQMKAALSA